jgi:hypothetical protein
MGDLCSDAVDHALELVALPCSCLHSATVARYASLYETPGGVIRLVKALAGRDVRCDQREAARGPGISQESQIRQWSEGVSSR